MYSAKANIGAGGSFGSLAVIEYILKAAARPAGFEREADLAIHLELPFVSGKFWNPPGNLSGKYWPFLTAQVGLGPRSIQMLKLKPVPHSGATQLRPRIESVREICVF